MGDLLDPDRILMRIAAAVGCKSGISGSLALLLTHPGGRSANQGQFGRALPGRRMAVLCGAQSCPAGARRSRQT
jgi:hypothetical protein